MKPITTDGEMDTEERALKKIVDLYKAVKKWGGLNQSYGDDLTINISKRSLLVLVLKRREGVKEHPDQARTHHAAETCGWLPSSLGVWSSSDRSKIRLSYYS